MERGLFLLICLVNKGEKANAMPSTPECTTQESAISRGSASMAIWAKRMMSPQHSLLAKQLSSSPGLLGHGALRSKVSSKAVVDSGDVHRAEKDRFLV